MIDYFFQISNKLNVLLKIYLVENDVFVFYYNFKRQILTRNAHIHDIYTSLATGFAVLQFVPTDAVTDGEFTPMQSTLLLRKMYCCESHLMGICSPGKTETCLLFVRRKPFAVYEMFCV